MALSKAKINKIVQKAIGGLGDLPLSITYVSSVVGEYDPDTNERAVVETPYSNVKAVQTALSKSEADWFPAERNTQKLLIAALDLPVEPQTEDNVQIDGVLWSVKRVKHVPGKSLYIVFIQEP